VDKTRSSDSRQTFTKGTRRHFPGDFKLNREYF